MEKDFGKWLNNALSECNINASELSAATGIDKGYVSKIRNGKMNPSKNAKYSIIKYFKSQGITYISEEQSKECKNMIFHEWLNITLEKNAISNKEILQELEISKNTMEAIRKGRLQKKSDVKASILYYLNKEYGVDITYGVALLDKEVAKCRRFDFWLKYEMAKAGVSEVILASEMGCDMKTVKQFTSAIRMPDEFWMIKILKVLKSYDDTIDESEKLQQFYELEAKYRAFGDWMSKILLENNIANVQLAEGIQRNITTVIYYKMGRHLPSKEVAAEIFEYFTSIGIDVEEGLKIWKELR